MRTRHLLAAGIVLPNVPLADVAAERKGELRYATRAERKACLVADEKLRTRQAEMRKKQEGHDARLLQPQQETDALATEQRRVDTADDEQVGAFNRTSGDRSRRVDEVDRDAELAQAALDRLHAETLEYDCSRAPLVYRLSDRVAVAREIEAGK